MMRKKRIYFKKIYLIICSILILIFGLVIIDTGKAISLYWHLRYPSPIIWEGVKIIVPKDMIGKFSDDENDKTFGIFNIEDPDKLTVIFNKIEFSKYDFGEKLDNNIKNAGYLLLEKGNTNIGGYNAYFIRTRNIKNSEDYIEDIFIEHKNIKIHFTGLEANKKKKLDILSNISFQEKE